MVVVPGLAERRDRQPGDVRGLVLDVEAAGAEEVADRVDRPRDVVDEEDAHEAAPDVAADGALHGEPVQHVAQDGREQQRDQDKPREALADLPHDGVLVEILGVALPVGLALGLGQPARVSVPEAAQAGAVADVGRVRVALLIGVRVVLAVVGDPVEHGALHRQRAGDGERVAQPSLRLEGAVGQHPVEADRDPAGRHEVHRREDPQVDPVHPGAPQQDDGQQDPDEGDDHPGEVGVALSARHTLEARMHVRPPLVP